MKFDRKYAKWMVLFGIVIVGFLVTACILYSAHAGTYEALLIDWYETYQDPTAPENATVTFNGVTYTGTYQETMDLLPQPYIQHTYRGDKYEFSIRSDTGKLCEFKDRLPLKDMSTVDKSYCRQLADSIVDDYFDLDEYLVKEECSVHGENYIMTYTYYKDFDGYQSADRYWIRINGNGEVEYFTMYGAGSFADVKRVSVNEKKVKKAIKEKLEEIYAGTTVPVEKFEIQSEGLLLKMEDGSCAVYFDVGGIGQGALMFAVKVDYIKK